MSRAQYTYSHPRPSVTVDIAVVTREPVPRVLLIRRKHPPFAGSWALPGGFIEMDETLEASARRELFEETGLKPRRLTQIATFGEPDRDPRGRTISVVFLTRVDRGEGAIGADDAAEANWFPLTRLPKLAFDHKQVLKSVRRWIDTKAT